MGDKMSDKTNEPVKEFIEYKELKGLTEQEAALRVEQGLDNRADTTTDKSIKEIIFSNAFTYFNLIFFNAQKKSGQILMCFLIFLFAFYLFILNLYPLIF